MILASGGAGDGARVAIYTDSLSSTDVLCGESPSALLMRVIQSDIVGRPECLALAPTLITGHCFDEDNPCADLASRGRFAELEALCAALGVMLRCVVLGRAALDFAARVWQRSLPALKSGCTTAHGQMVAPPFAQDGDHALLVGLAVWSLLQLGTRTLQRQQRPLSAPESERTTAHGQMMSSPFAHSGACALLAALAAASPSPYSAQVSIPAELGL